MDRGLVNLKELRNNIAISDFQGKSGYCFIKGNKIIKVYARSGDKGFFIPLDNSKVVDFSKYSADTIVFPDEYIYEDGKIVGEISKYIKSKTIDKSFNNHAKIKAIVDGYEKVIDDFYLYNNIDMVDLCFINILFSNSKGFHIIDTTEWCIRDNSLNKNIYSFNSSLITILVEYLKIPVKYSKYYNKIDNDFFKNIEKYGKAGKKLQDSLILLMNNKYHFLNIVFAYMDMYRIYCGNDIENLKEMKEFTKVLKKG